MNNSILVLILVVAIVFTGCTSHDPRAVVYDPAALSLNERQFIVSEVCEAAAGKIVRREGVPFEFKCNDVDFKNIDQKDKDNLPTMTVDIDLTTVKYISAPLKAEIILEGKKYEVTASIRFFKPGDKPKWKITDLHHKELKAEK